MRKKNLLIDEYPLLVLPSLAKAIGLNNAIALQQLHYWLENPKGGVMLQGERWVYNTYEDWQKDNFPFWSVHTVQRVFMSLEKIGFVISMQKAGYDRKKYYRVHYANLASWNETDCHNAEFQDGTMEEAKVASSLTETTPETKQTSEFPLEWKLAHGEDVTQQDFDDAKENHQALPEFERALGFGTLPWSSNSTWEKFMKFVVKIYAADPKVFSDYAAWREGDGKYKAFSNRKIRENPVAFMDTGYPEFEASKMYQKKTYETRPEYQPLPQGDEHAIPNPNTRRPAIISGPHPGTRTSGNGTE